MTVNRKFAHSYDRHACEIRMKYIPTVVKPERVATVKKHIDNNHHDSIQRIVILLDMKKNLFSSSFE